MRDPTAGRRVPLIAVGSAVRALPPAARFTLRGGPDVAAAAGRALDLALPLTACRAVSAGERAALWLGPDEWLLLAPEGAAIELEAGLSAALGALSHSLVDVSHRQTALEVHGAQAETLLAAGCPLDLDAGAFPVGMCTRSMLAKAEIVLWRTGGELFRIEVWRSFAAYLSRFLAEAARGLNSGGFP
jgi:sarcosine oxidase subunit gamma